MLLFTGCLLPGQHGNRYFTFSLWTAQERMQDWMAQQACTHIEYVSPCALAMGGGIHHCLTWFVAQRGKRKEHLWSTVHITVTVRSHVFSLLINQVVLVCLQLRDRMLIASYLHMPVSRFQLQNISAEACIKSQLHGDTCEWRMCIRHTEALGLGNCAFAFQWSFGTCNHYFPKSVEAVGYCVLWGQWCQDLVRDLFLYMLCLGMSYTTNGVLFVHVAVEEEGMVWLWKFCSRS